MSLDAKEETRWTMSTHKEYKANVHGNTVCSDSDRQSVIQLSEVGEGGASLFLPSSYWFDSCRKRQPQSLDGERNRHRLLQHPSSVLCFPVQVEVEI